MDDNDPRRVQPLERTRCTIMFAGFSNADPATPELGPSVEVWKQLAVSLEAQFPDPYRLLRCFKMVPSSPPLILFLWRLHVHLDGSVNARVERCHHIRTPGHWWDEDDDHSWGIAVQASTRYAVEIYGTRLHYVTQRNESLDTVETIAADIAGHLRLATDPAEYLAAV